MNSMMGGAITVMLDAQTGAAESDIGEYILRQAKEQGLVAPGKALNIAAAYDARERALDEREKALEARERDLAARMQQMADIVMRAGSDMQFRPGHERRDPMPLNESG